MPLILSGNVASATAAVGYDVANSCRFNDGDSAFMSKTQGTGTNTTKMTLSVWIKRGALGTEQQIFETWNDNNNRFDILFKSSTDQLEIQNTLAGATTINLKTDRVFRDPAWMNIVVIVDSTQGTAANRVKLYINGTQETSFATETYLDEDANLALGTSSYTNFIGKYSSSGGNFFDGYMAEVVYLDGTAASIGDLGEFDDDSPTIWKPIDVSGLTFGNNGAYLDFEASDNLGNDANGGTDYGETNLAATDQATDSPTNNFCTLNPLATFAYNPHSFSEGNTVFHGGADQWQGSIGTFGVTTGKWYYEVKMVTTDSVITDSFVGFMGYDEVDITSASSYNGSGAFFYNSDGGEIKVGNTSSHTITTADYGTFSNGDIMGIALDYDNEYLSIYKNGSALATNYDFSGITNSVNGGKIAIPAILGYGGDNAAHIAANFGNPYFSISSGNADANGYGNFEYSVPSGYLALCTKNLGSDGG